ncbi:unnamed protein product, partial [Owenia fusiformis]
QTLTQTDQERREICLKHFETSSKRLNMMYTTSVLVLLVACTVVAPDPLNPPKCCAKELFQADIQLTQGVMIDGQGMAHFLDGRWSFDPRNKTNAFVGKMTMYGQEKQVKFIQTAAKKQYNILDGACQVIPKLYPTVGDGCIPDNAIFKGQEILGRDFVVWTAHLLGDRYNLVFEVTVTPDCVPVTMTITGEINNPVLGKMGLATTMRFSSFQEGVEDLSVFDIPDFCPKEL